MDNEEQKQTESSILDKIISINHKNALHDFEPAKVIYDILEKLKTREKEVITKRFGLQGEKKKTLEQIGKEYSVSRERIRQIEKTTIEKLNLPTLKKIINPGINLIIDTIKEDGGVLTEERINKEILNTVKQTQENINALRFILEIEDKFIKIKEEKLKKSWSIIENPQRLIIPTIQSFEKILQEAKKVQEYGFILQKFKIQDFYKKNQLMLSDNFLLSCLEVGENIMKTDDGRWGLKYWPNINPRNIKDKAFYVLRKHKKPTHFRTIAQMITEANFDKKPVNSQAVHNELVKDKKFVLVGRGIYGLAEWGLKPGTVVQVIEEIFKKEGKPLSKDEIIKKVLEKRQVNSNTIVLNLQEKPQFIRVKKSTYALKKGSNKK